MKKKEMRKRHEYALQALACPTNPKPEKPNTWDSVNDYDEKSLEIILDKDDFDKMDLSDYYSTDPDVGGFVDFTNYPICQEALQNIHVSAVKLKNGLGKCLNLSPRLALALQISPVRFRARVNPCNGKISRREKL